MAPIKTTVDVTAIFKWVGTAFTIIGALLTAASGFDPWNVLAFNIGALSWLIAAVRMREASLITVNAVLLSIYVLGVIVRI